MWYLTWIIKYFFFVYRFLNRGLVSPDPHLPTSLRTLRRILVCEKMSLRTRVCYYVLKIFLLLLLQAVVSTSHDSVFEIWENRILLQKILVFGEIMLKKSSYFYPQSIYNKKYIFCQNISYSFYYNFSELKFY